MIARIHDDGEPKVGSTISLIKLSIRFGKGVDWIRRQGVTITYLRFLDDSALRWLPHQRP